MQELLERALKLYDHTLLNLGYNQQLSKIGSKKLMIDKLIIILGTADFAMTLPS